MDDEKIKEIVSDILDEKKMLRYEKDLLRRIHSKIKTNGDIFSDQRKVESVREFISKLQESTPNPEYLSWIEEIAKMLDIDVEGRYQEVVGDNQNTRKCLVCWGNGYVPSDEKDKKMEKCTLCDGTGKISKVDNDENSERNKIQKDDIVMIIEDNRPTFQTVERVGKNTKSEKVVWTEEGKGWYHITDCYTKKWINEYFDNINKEDNKKCPFCGKEKELIYNIHLGEICEECYDEIFEELKNEKKNKGSKKMDGKNNMEQIESKDGKEEKRFFPQEWLVKSFDECKQETGLEIIEYKNKIEIAEFVEDDTGDITTTNKISIEKGIEYEDLYYFLGEIFKKETGELPER